jgi:N-ethylmaleimide reductase
MVLRLLVSLFSLPVDIGFLFHLQRLAWTLGGMSSHPKPSYTSCSKTRLTTSSQTAANGWLPDQFLNTHTNLRTDAYGGSIPNRARFTLELLDAITAAIGLSKTAIRLSPFGMFLIPLEADPIGTFSYLVEEIEKRGLAYVCLIHPRTDMLVSEDKKLDVLNTASVTGAVKISKDDVHLRHFTKLLKDTPVFVNGNYDGENCFEEVEGGEVDAVMFGRWFISNPDLVEKIRKGRKLTPYVNEMFYEGGEKGYTDYPVGDGKKEIQDDKHLLTCSD